MRLVLCAAGAVPGHGERKFNRASCPSTQLLQALSTQPTAAAHGTGEVRLLREAQYHRSAARQG